MHVTTDSRPELDARASGSGGATTRVLQRVVLPVEADKDVLPLYVEGSQQFASTSVSSRSGDSLTEGVAAAPQQLTQVISRRRYQVLEGHRSSFGTYFNAFPASYWRRWTEVSSVRLRMRLTGSGTVFIYRSNAKGNVYRVDSVSSADFPDGDLVFTLPLATFADGGWYWFDLLGATGGLVLDSAQWETEADRRQGRVSVAITTLNRAEDVLTLVSQLGADTELAEILDEVIVVDQGSEHPTEHPRWAETAASLGSRLRVIRQANLGGSGGFARGMSEVIDAGKSDYVLLSDDDVRAEPEGIVRAVAFADLARTPTIVGGQMFSMFDRSYLHSMGERIQPWRFWWQSVLQQTTGHHLDRSSLRSTPELHRRVDVDYNGWWMELIPVGVLRQTGLALPVFIKWDDAEYSLRAKQVGVPTVTLPGVAVWHVPWTDKDDSLDWQAYYHERNRFVAALLHSQYPRGGRLVRESLIHQVRHLLAAQYSVADLRLRALEDVMSGPDHLHSRLATTLPEIRRVRSGYADSQVHQDPGAFPSPRRVKLPRKGEDTQVQYGKYGKLPQIKMAAVGMVKALRPVRASSREHPEAEIAAMSARWWLLSQYDSAIVSTSDGGGASWYQRDPRRFRDLLRRSFELHERIIREWPALAASYREAMPTLVGPEEWKRTFVGRDEH